MTSPRASEHYAHVETELQALLPDLQTSLPLESWRWIEEWTRAGEYGLAVELAAEAVLCLASEHRQLQEKIVDLAALLALETDPIRQLRELRASDRSAGQ
jgi:hypothetical protein